MLSTIYIGLVLFTGINFLLVALILTWTGSNKFVDVVFTVREWFLAMMFIAAALLNNGRVARYMHVQENIHIYLTAFISMLVIASMASVGALLYNYCWYIALVDKPSKKKDDPKED